MSVLAATEAHLVGEVQVYTPRSDEWRKTSGSLNSVDWERVTTAVDHGCYDSLDDEAIIKHYLDPPCTGLAGQHLPRQKKSRLRRIRNMLKSAPSAAASASPFPPPPQYDHLLSKPTGAPNASAAENDAEEEAVTHKRETFIHTVEDMAIGMSSSLCSQSSTVSSTVSDPSFSTCTTSTTADDIHPRFSPPPPPMRSSSRLKLAFSKFRGGDHTKQIVPELAKLESRDSVLTVAKTESFANRIRSKLHRHKSETATITTAAMHDQKISRCHSMSSIAPYQQRKNYHPDPLNPAAASASADRPQGPKGILRVRPSRSKSHHRTPHFFDRQRSSSRPLSSSTSTSHLMSPHSRLSMPLIQASAASIVRFASIVSVRETFSKYEYDRGSDPRAVCTRLTPAMAQYIKQELNMYKLHEMHVHQHSRTNTHFFL